MLVAQAEQWARKQGCSIVRLWSNSVRTDSHRFYEELGYTNMKTQYAQSEMPSALPTPRVLAEAHSSGRAQRVIGNTLLVIVGSTHCPFHRITSVPTGTLPCIE